MNKLLLLLTAVTNFAFAQQKVHRRDIWHLTVADSVSAKGIDRVTISVNKRYYTTDVNGAIDINTALINSKDSITFSCVGYKSYVLTPKMNYTFPDTLRLSASLTSLKEVKVGFVRPIETIMGDVKKSYNAHRITAPNTAFAQFIPNPKKIKGTITSVEYVVNDELHGIEMPFRVRLYTKNKTSLALDRELIKDSIIVYNPEKKHRIKVDVSGYNVQLPEDGVIVIFETLSPSYYTKGTIWYNNRLYRKMPGIDMDLKKKNDYSADIYDKNDRKESYCMVGPVADRWNFGGLEEQWYAYNSGINFAITLTISQLF